MLKRKGYSLLEIFVALASASLILGLMGMIFTHHSKARTGIENSSKAMQDSLVISERITGRMRYTSPSLVTLYSEHNDGKSCDAIGFPMLSSGKGYVKAYPSEIGMLSLSYECLEKIKLPKTWQSYSLYYHDKEGKYGDRLNLYEITYQIDYSKDLKNGVNHVTALQKQSELKDQPSDSSGRLSNLLGKAGRISMKKIAGNVVSIGADMNNLPSIRLYVSVRYGIEGSSGTSDRRGITDENGKKVYEVSDMNWTVLPLN